MQPVTCACARCRAMCEFSTCLPTEAEAQQLIDAGYGDRLATYRWPDSPRAVTGPAPKGKEGQTLATTMSGACTFRLPDGRCELHDLGLKPLEGRLALHNRPWQMVRTEVLRHWTLLKA